MRQIELLVVLAGVLVCLSCGDDADGVASPTRPNGGAGSGNTGGGSGTGVGGGAANGGANGGAGGDTGGGGSGSGQGGSGSGVPCESTTETCEVLTQCGCAFGAACDFAGSAMACRDAGNTPLGSACETNVECASGGTCILGACKRFCVQNSDCGPTGAVCMQIKTTGDSPVDIPGFKVCLDHCEPWDVTSCGSGAACQPHTGLGVIPGTTYCTTGGTSTASCPVGTLCAPGYGCFIDGASVRDCRKYCRPGLPGECPAGQTCRMLADGGNITGYFLGDQVIGMCGS